MFTAVEPSPRVSYGCRVEYRAYPQASTVESHIAEPSVAKSPLGGFIGIDISNMIMLKYSSNGIVTKPHLMYDQWMDFI